MPGLIERLLERDPQAIARAISIVESDPALAGPLLAALQPHVGRAYCVGITGPPGAGKSTLVSQLVRAMRTRGRVVAVLAIDPSSPFSGGAILGDRVRMQDHTADTGVFVRSMATRGQLGGIAAATADAVAVLDAAGFDVIIIETVGVGQDEVDIVRLADVSVVVLVPNAGDDVQALKAGLMEIADVFVVNKADLGGADRVTDTVLGMLSLAETSDRAVTPPVCKVSALTGEGVDELIEAIERLRDAGAPRKPRRRMLDGVSDPVKAARRLGQPIEGASLPDATLDHVAIAVRDERALTTFLRDVLGLEMTAPEAVVSQNVRVSFAGSGPARVEIVSPLPGDSALDRFLAKRGDALHHIAFRVDDLEAALVRLQHCGVRLIDAAPRLGAHGTRVAFLHPSSTGGVLVELVAGGDDATR
jgi:LAO/AO transport system kinase